MDQYQVHRLFFICIIIDLIPKTSSLVWLILLGLTIRPFFVTSVALHLSAPGRRCLRSTYQGVLIVPFDRTSTIGIISPSQLLTLRSGVPWAHFSKLLPQGYSYFFMLMHLKIVLFSHAGIVRAPLLYIALLERYINLHNELIKQYFYLRLVKYDLLYNTLINCENCHDSPLPLICNKCCGIN